jgi:hypothetical protein
MIHVTHVPREPLKMSDSPVSSSMLSQFYQQCLYLFYTVFFTTQGQCHSIGAAGPVARRHDNRNLYLSLHTFDEPHFVEFMAKRGHSRLGALHSYECYKQRRQQHLSTWKRKLPGLLVLLLTYHCVLPRPHCS